MSTQLICCLSSFKHPHSDKGFRSSRYFFLITISPSESSAQAYTLCQTALSEGLASSPLRKSLSTDGPIFEYSAPRDLGSGKISIFLHGDSPTWNTDDMSTLVLERPEQTLDALIALNAGLGSYESWNTVVYAAYITNLPFAVTEYYQQSLEYVVNGAVSYYQRSSSSPSPLI